MKYWAIDGGGSTTTALLDDGTRWRRGSVNPASVGATRADDELQRLFQAISEKSGQRSTRGWLATATVDADTAEHEIDRIARLAGCAGLTGDLLISRDIVPLLAAPPLRGRGLVIVCGTGSGFLAGDGVHEPLSVGGCEYLGSDEGSAFALGMDGLRAAVRSTDGRSAPTALQDALAEYAGVPVRELARRLATEPFPKASVAALSATVCGCWLDGDAVAGEVVRAAVDHLVDGARAARDRAELTRDWPATLAGGVFRGCPEFAESLGARIVDELGATTARTVITDPVEAVLAAVRDHGDGLPRFLGGRWAWMRSLPGDG
ncbi:MAG: BadF/BadG/BcrA/BcrD ATPase family protein [Mycobacterium leprae]